MLTAHAAPLTRLAATAHGRYLVGAAAVPTATLKASVIEGDVAVSGLDPNSITLDDGITGITLDDGITLIVTG